MISVKNLSKHYGSLVAVDDLTLEVPKGELFCFLGPNGAGKTTTIKLMTGLLRPRTGSIEICGINIEKDPVNAKLKMGYVPDMPYLYDRLTTTEFFRFTGEIYSLSHDHIELQLDEQFKTFSLDEYRNVLVKDLSHGLRQRLVYAATFLHNPEVLFIDEPLVGLDPYTIRLIKDLLIERTRNGMTIFLTTHILALAEDVADRIGIIMKGKVVALGPLAQLTDEAGEKNLEDVFLKLTAEQYDKPERQPQRHEDTKDK
ncbi:MAG: ABC transporter ATP-binding protein [Kiritimatiellia bacterium]|jgi:ABC-2 type transport system ATP-binding protein|nr:ABC transporter ATP-binding protein [Kiritimatiellia bacterium]MDP6811515.1 ABC transporter ATP-binding protein [Kiritimatiellia bacterium]MDP7023689.1 ABC transporter ATP-binding protein [Kiritimatiellia bacterium]